MQKLKLKLEGIVKRLPTTYNDAIAYIYYTQIRIIMIMRRSYI